MNMKQKTILYLGTIIVLGLMVFPNSYCENVEANPGFHDEVGWTRCYNEHPSCSMWAEYNYYGVHIYSYPETLVVEWELTDTRDHYYENDTLLGGHDAYSGEFKLEDIDTYTGSPDPSFDMHEFEVAEDEIRYEEGDLTLTWTELPEMDHTHIKMSVSVDGGPSDERIFVVWFHDGEPQA